MPLIKTKLHGSRKIIFKEEAKTILEYYNWPGNIRELLRFAEVISLNNSGIIKAEDVIEFTKNSTFKLNKSLLNDDHYALIKKVGLSEFLNMFSREIATRAMLENDNKATLAIKELKTSNATFYRYFDKETSEPRSKVRLKVKEFEHELQ